MLMILPGELYLNGGTLKLMFECSSRIESLGLANFKTIDLRTPSILAVYSLK